MDQVVWTSVILSSLIARGQNSTGRFSHLLERSLTCFEALVCVAVHSATCRKTRISPSAFRKRKESVERVWRHWSFLIGAAFFPFGLMASCACLSALVAPDALALPFLLACLFALFTALSFNGLFMAVSLPSTHTPASSLQCWQLPVLSFRFERASSNKMSLRHWILLFSVLALIRSCDKQISSIEFVHAHCIQECTRTNKLASIENPISSWLPVFPMCIKGSITDCWRCQFCTGHNSSICQSGDCKILPGKET